MTTTFLEEKKKHILFFWLIADAGSIHYSHFIPTICEWVCAARVAVVSLNFFCYKSLCRHNNLIRKLSKL